VSEEHHLTSEQEQRLVALSLIGSFLGGALIINSFIARYFFTDPRGVENLCALVGAVLLGTPIVVRAISDLIHGERHMIELVAIAVVACMAIGRYQEAGVVSFLMLLADLIQHRTALGARQAIEGLIRMTPTRAHLVENGQVVDVEAASLRPGQVIRIRPGEVVPADGEIVTGVTTMNEASITGESLPVDKGLSGQVFAGAVNLTGSVEARVTRVGADTTLGQVRNLIMDAEKTKIPLMRIIDQYIRWYTPVVIMIAFTILFFTQDMIPAITALLVTCPCAFVLATPTAMVAALSAAARLGILVKDVGDLEEAGRLNAIAFDKTGTLTTGQLAVTRLAPAPNVDPARMLLYAASAESHSNHPVAQAVVRVAREAKLDLPEASDIHEEAGKGVRAVVNGAQVMIGRETWLKDEKVDFSNLTVDPKEMEGYSILYVAENRRVLGWIGLEDKARPEAKKATADLRKIGIRRLTMFTGDRWSVARRVAGELGCTEVEAECLPARKLELVRKMKDSGMHVAVVGDGVNDAPALAAGDIGIAMGAAGSDVAIHSASIALMSNDLQRLPFLIRLSRRTRTIVNQNLAFALVFIVVGLSLAALKILTPITAAALHVFGSFVVIFNSARLVRFGEEMTPYGGNPLS
jgi:Cd2+/Zn2+-exporting ATPase